jgi:hypothetical protein
MKMTKTTVALYKGFAFIPSSTTKNENRNLAMTVQANLMQYGYLLSDEAFQFLANANRADIINFNDECIIYLKEMMGGRYDYEPMYKNFPEEVMSMSDCELFWNQIIHYLSNGEWMPESIEMERPVNFENIKYTVLESISQRRFMQIFTDLCSINTSLTPVDSMIILWFCKEYDNLLNGLLPKEIPFKETLCMLASFGLDVPVKTVTDVLRIAVYMSGGDSSLPKVPRKTIKANAWFKKHIPNPAREKFKFKKFTRAERKYILSLLEKTNCDAKEGVLKANRWVRLGERIHPTEYKNKFPKAAKFFDEIRNENPTSWYSDVNKAFNTSFESGLQKLSERAGEFSRRMDALVRNNPNHTKMIMEYFASSAAKTSNKVLFEVYTHFESRAKKQEYRRVTIKGSRTAYPLPTLDALPVRTIGAIQQSIWDILRTKFSNLDKLGKVYIDDELRKIPLPTNMRSLNMSLKPRIRGQRIAFDNPDAKVIRAFVYWMDEHGGEDLDLSATFVGDKKTGLLSFQNLKFENNLHSGDVRHREGPCAEYVDINIVDTLAKGYRYVMIDVRNFNGRSLASVESVFGLMEREHPESNKLWYPQTITNTQMLQSEATSTLVTILDLETKEYIFIDEDSNGRPVASLDSSNVIDVINHYSKLPAVSVFDILLLHTEARGLLVENKEDADTCFMLEDFTNSYEDIAKMML